MYNENQIVEVRWNNSNKDWYEQKGYVFTKRNELFQVKAKDLSPHSSKKIEVVCDYCGKTFTTQFALITSGRRNINKDCCSTCTGLKTSEVSSFCRISKIYNNLLSACKSRNYILLTPKTDILTVKDTISFICPKHSKQTMMADNLIRGHECIKCSYEKRFDNVRLDRGYINDIISSTNNVWLNPEEYTNCFDRNLHIKCKCGNTFTTSFVNYYKANVNRCSLCSKKESQGELRIREFLEKNNIEYIQEKRFNDCRDQKTLPFDFYIPEHRLCIEFDGQQHYSPIFSEDGFKATQKHDKIKNDYCLNHNIKLLRIPYWQGNDIEDVLKDNLKI